MTKRVREREDGGEREDMEKSKSIRAHARMKETQRDAYRCTYPGEGVSGLGFRI